jgi:hypothetical protein
LLDLHPAIEPIRLAAEGLVLAGVLAPLPGREAFPFRVAESVLGYEEEVTGFCQSWADAGRRLWLAALAGDWSGAHDEAMRRSDPVLVEITATKVQQCRILRQERLLLARREERLAPAALRGLADLRSDALPGALADPCVARPRGSRRPRWTLLGDWTMPSGVTGFTSCSAAWTRPALRRNRTSGWRP